MNERQSALSLGLREINHVNKKTPTQSLSRRFGNLL